MLVNTVDVEKAFIGCLIYNSKELPKAIAAKVKSAWFTDLSCGICWEAAESLWGSQSKITGIAIVKEALKIMRKRKLSSDDCRIDDKFYDECVKYLAHDDARDITSYTNLLRAEFMKRAAADICNEHLKACNLTNDPSRELSALTSDIANLQASEGAVHVEDCGSIAIDIVNRYRRAYEEFAINKNYDYCDGIPYPWRAMNRISNGLQPGGLHIIAARPSVGKTSFVLQLVDYWCRKNLKVAFNCLDMSVQQLLKRPIDTLSQVGLTKAASGRTAGEIDQKDLLAAAEEVKRRNDEGLFTAFSEYDVNSFKSLCQAKKAAGGLDIVIVDYAQQLQASGLERKTENERLTYVSSVLKSIAIELNIPVIALSQLSRSIESDENERRPKLSDLRGSGSLEQDAMSVSFLYRDSGVVKLWKDTPPVDFCEDGNPEDAEAFSPVWWSMEKNQNGSTGHLPLIARNDVFSWYLGFERAAVPNGPLPGKYQPKFSKITRDWRADTAQMKHFEKMGLLLS